MKRQQIFTSAGAALLAAGLLFGGPPQAQATGKAPAAADAQQGQAGRNLGAGSAGRRSGP